MEHINNETFDKTIKEGKVIVDFWAEWCGPCKMIGPIFEELEGEMKDVKFAKVDVDENQDLAGTSGVRGIPTMILFRDGKEVDRIVGALPKELLKEKIEGIFK